MDSLETKKEQLKKMAEGSVIFAASREALQDFIKGIDLVPNDEQGAKIIDRFIEMFQKEKVEIESSFEKILLP